MKKNNSFLIIAIIIVVLVVLGLLSGKSSIMSTLEGDVVQRTFSATTYESGGTLDITFTPIPLGTYGIKQNIPDGWSVIYSSGGDTVNGIYRIITNSEITIKLQAPNEGDYVFSGEYFIGGDSDWLPFLQKSISLCEPNCRWDLVGECMEVLSDGCGGECTRDTGKNTVADLNCDGCVSDAEIPHAIDNWMKQVGVSDAEIPVIITKWISQEGC